MKVPGGLVDFRHDPLPQTKLRLKNFFVEDGTDERAHKPSRASHAAPGLC